MAGETDISVAAVIIKAELAEFKKTLAELPGIGAEEARDMVRAIQKEMKQLESNQKATMKQVAKAHADAANEAKKAAAQAGNSWNAVAKKLQSNQAISDIEQIGAMFIMVGGSASKMAMLFTSAVRPVAMLNEILTATFGPAATAMLGIAALPVALIGVVGALSAMTNGAIEAEANLRKFGLVTGSGSAALREYTWASNDLSIAFDELKLAMGEEVAPAMTTLLNAVAGAVRTFGNLREAIEPVKGVLQEIGRVGLFLSTAGLSEMSLAAIEAAASSNTLGDSYDNLQKSIQATHDAYIKRVTAEQQTLEINKQMQEDAAALQDILDAEAVAESEATAAKERKAEAAREAAKAEAEHAAKVREYKQAVLEQTALDLYAATQRVEAAERVEEAIEAERQAYLQAIRDKGAARRQEVEEEQARALALLNYGGMIADNLSSIGDSIVNSYAQRAAEGEKLSQKEKELALAAFEASQALAIAGATVAAIQTGVNVANQLTAVFVPFPAALAAGIAATGTLLAGQVAAIEQTPPPEFPMGMTPDHQIVGKRWDEGIASSRAMRDIGGPEVLDRLNRGEGLPSGSDPEQLAVLRQIRDYLRPARGSSVLSAVAANKRRG